MTLAARIKKNFYSVLLVTAGVALGCAVSSAYGSLWPWNPRNDYDMKQTGNYIGASAEVARFGASPKPVTPLSPETTEPSDWEKPVESRSPSAKPDGKSDAGSSSSAAAAGLDQNAGNAALPDFWLQVIKTVAPSYLPDAGKSEYAVTAFNRGLAPVSLGFDIDPPSHQRWSADRPLPLHVVIPPNSELVVAHLSAKASSDSGVVRYSYAWSRGDYTASHLSPEHYQFPFPKDVKARASMAAGGRSTPADNTITFLVPVNTPVLPARKGTVVRIKGNNSLDVLHDDSTIASYEHLGGIDQGVTLGRVVSTEDRIGIVGALGKEKDGYMRLTVWRPEPWPPASPNTGSSSLGFDLVSLPLEFCSPNFKGCRALTNNQPVSRGALGQKKERKGRGGSR